MDDKMREMVRMIGLHKLSGDCGDAIIPELYALLGERQRGLAETQGTAAGGTPSSRIVRFPLERTWRSVWNPLALALTERSNIVAFQERAARSRRAKEGL